MLRKIYYWLSPSLRLLVRKAVFFPIDLFNRKAGIPPRGLIYTGSGDFVKQGKEWLQFFKTGGHLQENGEVLDIGSGIGRMAIPLSKYLTTGNYYGFEAMEVGVNWCVENISKKHPNFHFKHVPLHNDLYNAVGQDAAKYEFEYPANSFDMACAISVFTHMIPAELENYLQQAAKVLKPNAYLVATFFILDKESESLMKTSNFSFDYKYEGYALMDDKVKSANVAFQRDYFNDLLAKAGFEIEQEIKGSWCGRKQEKYIGFQDVFVLKKRA